MYQTNQAFLEAMDDISRTLAVQVEIGGDVYPTESIIDFELERGAFDGDVFTIGQTLSSALTLTIFTTSSVKIGDEVKLFTDLLVGDSYVRVPMGVYYVDSTSVNQEKMTLTCYDKMVSLVEEYIPSGDHKTLAALFNDVRTQIGMKYDGAFTDVAIKQSLYGYTYRETLGFIASLNGGNMIINRSGNLEIQGYQEVERHIPAKTCFSFDVKEGYHVSKVFCLFGDVGISRGDNTGQCVSFENPYVTEQNIDVIYNRLKGLRFTAGSLKCRGDLTLDPGDLFAFTDYKGDKYRLMCGRNKLTFNGGLSGQLESIGESENSNVYAEHQLKYKKNMTKVTAELGKIQAIVQEIEQSHDGLEERVKKAELEMTADAITSKIKDSFVSKDEVENLVTQEELTSAISQTTNDITLQVSSNYETKQNVTTKVNSAISTAASDAQTKATNALNSAKTYADTKKTEAINSAKSTLTETIKDYYTKSQTNSAIQVAKEEINLGVSTIYETKENVETSITNASSDTLKSAKSYADTKKSEAISSASTDATNKVNAAKNELNTAIGKKANSADVYTKSQIYTKTETDSAINVAKDAINLSVSNTYETKTNVTTKVNSAISTAASDATNKVNAVQIGGRNLLKNSAGDKTTGWMLHGGSSTLSLVSAQTAPMGKAIQWKVNADGATGFYLATRVRDVEQGEVCSSSVWVKANRTIPVRIGCEKGGQKTVNVTSSWQKVTNTFTVNSNQYQAFAFYVSDPATNSKAGDIIFVHSVKLEVGNKPTDWTPAPEDVAGDITKAKTDAINSANNTTTEKLKSYSTTEQMNSAISVAKNEINSSVSNTYTTKTEFNDAQTSITSLQNRVNAAEQKITDQAIINTVSSTYTTKAEFNALSIGGVNLYTNTKVIVKDQWGNKDSWTTDETYNGFTVFNRTGAWLGLYRSDVNFELNETYTLSVWAKGDGDASLNFYSANSSISVLNKNFTQNSIISTDWVRYFITFKVKNTDVPLNARFENAIAKSTLSLYGFKLEKGNKATDWSPAPEDLTAYADSVGGDISANVADLSQIVSANTGSDAITPATKVQLVAEFDDITAIYNKINSIYAAIGDTSMSSLKTDMTTAYNNVKSMITTINDTIAQVSETGLSDIVSKFSAFYEASEELQAALTNAVTNKTTENTTKITQLADSYNIAISKVESIEGDVDTLTTNFQFASDGLTIKSSANSTKYIKLDNDSLDFIDSGNMVAQISDNDLKISNATVNNQMKIGNISIKPSGKGGLMFVYE